MAEYPVLGRRFEAHADEAVADLTDEVVADVSTELLPGKTHRQRLDPSVGFAIDRILAFDRFVAVGLAVHRVDAGDVLDRQISKRDVGIELGALVLSEDGGDTWRERPPGSRRDNHSLATHPDREGRVYSAAGDGYAWSDDGGDSWEQVHDGLEHTYCWSVVPDPGDPDRVLVSSANGARSAHTARTADSYVYRREGDEPWQRLDGRGLPTGEGVVRAVFATTGEPGAVYAVTNRGLFRSSDFGDSWSRLDVDWDDRLETVTPRGLAVVR